VEEMLIAPVAESAPTDIANLEPSHAEKKDPPPQVAKTKEAARAKTVEIRITLGSDER
jgi:hypothetical protein